MLQKSARVVLAAVLALSLCPAMAFADDSSQSEGSGNPLADLFYMVVGYDTEDDVNVASSGGSLYQNTLTPPPASTTLPDLASATDYVNGGLLVGTAGNLYYLREATFSSSGSDNVYAYRTFERYNIETGTWTSLESLPTWFEYGSVAVFDGAIIFCGATMATDGGVPSHAANPEEHVYSYDPQSEYPSWTELNTTGVPVGAGIVNNGGVLEIVGGVQGSSLLTSVNVYEPSEGAHDSLGQLSSGVAAPKVIPHNGALYVYSFGSSVQDLQSGSGTPRLQVLDDGSASDLSSGLPLIESYSDSAGYPSARSAQFGGLGSCAEGVVIAGPTSQGDTADTYIMSWEDTSFAAYNLRANSDPLFGTAACVYLDKLYALGSTLDDSGDPVLSFSSTALEDSVLISGNNGVWRQGSDQPLAFVFSPDYGRFSNKVIVDDQELSMGRDYQAVAGSEGTVVSLMPEYLAQLSMGSHELSVFFDDGLTEISATFTVETEASSIAEGYTRPASLAMTFDAVPVAPIAACSVVALVALVIGLRMRRSSKL